MVYTERFATIQPHLTRVVDAITRGQLVIFLGADINLCGRPKDGNGQFMGWQLGHYPPSNRELAVYLDEASGFCYRQKVRCPLCDDRDIESLPEGCPLKQGAVTKLALQHVSQYVDLTEGGPDMLYGALCDLFQGKFLPNPVHKFFAQVPAILHEKGYCPPYPLIVTSCFDRTLEQTFDGEHQKYDLVSYVGDQKGGYFEHKSPEDVVPHKIEEPNKYQRKFLTQWPVILKLYGGYQENFVITEDQYIDYLSHRDVSELIPVELLAILKENPILFLGYSPSYWNLRVILHRIWPEQLTSQRSASWWAVEANPEDIDKALWKRYHSIPLGVPSLDNYIAELRQRVQDLPSRVPTVFKDDDNQDHPPTQVRDQVFISYSHKDRPWLEKLKTTLTPVMRTDHLSVWDDTLIEPGANWRQEIEKALARAKIAVLLVSANFLASDFIAEEEFPTLLEAAQKGGLKIIWIYLSDCLYKHSAIADYQAAHDLSQSLNHLPVAEQQSVLTQIGEKIIAAIKG